MADIDLDKYFDTIRQEDDLTDEQFEKILSRIPGLSKKDRDRAQQIREGKE